MEADAHLARVRVRLTRGPREFTAEGSEFVGILGGSNN